MKILLYVLALIVAAHGLIHLMGFVAYWPLAQLAELPYKTALLAGRWEVGAAGIRLFAVLWLLPALGFLAGVAGLLTGQGWWRPVMLGTVALSMVLITLDWGAAYRGAYVNAAILLLWGLASAGLLRL